MKIILLTVYILIKAVISSAQPGGHIGFGNTYTYLEKDGIDESNFFVSGIISDGRVFFHALGGSLFIKGSNYIRKIKFPVSVSPSHIEWVLEKGKNQYIAFGNPDPYYYFIENDSVIKAHRYPESDFDYFKNGNDLIIHSRTKLYRFEKDSFVCKSTVPDPGEGVVGFYTDADNNLWKVIRTASRFDFYSINKFWKPEFQFSLYLQEKHGIPTVFNIKKPVLLNLTGIGHLNNPNSPIVIPRSEAKFIFTSSHLQHSILTDQQDRRKKQLHILYSDKLMDHNLYDSITQSFYFGTFKKPFRYFPYLRKYPRIFNHTTASAIHAIVQDSSGRIWAGSYEGNLSIITENEVTEFREDGLTFLPGSFSTLRPEF